MIYRIQCSFDREVRNYIHNLWKDPQECKLSDFMMDPQGFVIEKKDNPLKELFPFYPGHSI